VSVLDLSCIDLLFKFPKFYDSESAVRNAVSILGAEIMNVLVFNVKNLYAHF
jgi:hypothetical protein